MRKFFKIVFVFILILLLIPVAGIIILKIKNSSFIGSSDKEFVEYLNNNKMTFDSKIFSGDKPLPIFNNDVYQSDIVLLGENHGYADVQDIDKALFLHFNKTKGTRYYIAEMDSTHANKLNLFLNGENKDTELLKEVVLYVKKRIPQQGGKELLSKWSDIYDYNKTLADSLKIRVIGVDKSIDDKTKILRDSAMMLNFVHAVEKDSLQNESFYGFFGLAHVIQGGLNADNFHYLAARLKNQNYNVKSILCIDIESEMYMPKNDQYPTPDDEKISFLGFDGPIVAAKGINDLKEAGETHTITLFNLDKEGSPYHHSQKLIDIKMNFLGSDFSPHDEKSSTTDFIQYVMFLRNAHSVTPLE